MTTSIPIAASSLLIVLNAAQPEPGGEVPWWASLILLPVLAVAIETIRRKLKLDQPPPPPVNPQPQEATAVPATTADSQLDRAEKYVELLEQIKTEQAAEIAKQDVEIEQLKGRVKWLEDQLQTLLGRLGPALPLPPQRSPGWTPPPGA